MTSIKSTRAKTSRPLALRRALLLGSMLAPLASLPAFADPAAIALPAGGAVRAGQATVARAGANALTVNQSSTNAIIDWSSFSIGLGASVTFNNGSGATLSLTINPAVLTASIIGDPTKTYDGTTAATLTSSNYQLAGLAGSDNFTIGQTSGTYNSAHVASATTVTANLLPANFVATGATKASNYSLPTTAFGNGKITPATLNIAANNESKFAGLSDPAFAYTITAGSLAQGDLLTGSLSRASGASPGAYTIGQGSLTASGDYVDAPETQLPFAPANGANANVFNSSANKGGPDFAMPSVANLNAPPNGGFDSNSQGAGGSPVNAPYPDNQSYWGDIQFENGSTQ
jgi:YDG domain/MBG domain (YGX type)